MHAPAWPGLAFGPVFTGDDVGKGLNAWEVCDLFKTWLSRQCEDPRLLPATTDWDELRCDFLDELWAGKVDIEWL